MSIVPDSKKDEVKPGWIAQIVPDLFFIGPGPDFGRPNFSVNPFDMDPGAVKGFLNHPVVAVFVIRGDPAFIPQVEAGCGPGPFQSSQALIEGFGSGAPGQGDMEGSAGLKGGSSQGFPTGHHGLHPSGGIGEFVQKHKVKECRNFPQKRWSIRWFGLAVYGELGRQGG